MKKAKLTIKNIGIIRDADIDLDGITVITGVNNSGKTTIGKVLYAFARASSELIKDYQADRYYFLTLSLSLYSTLSNYNSFGGYANKLQELLSNEYQSKLKFDSLQSYFEEVFNEIKKLKEKVDQSEAKSEYKFFFDSDRINHLYENYSDIVDQISNDSLDEYFYNRIQDILNGEFNFQVFPVKDSNEISLICLQDKEAEGPNCNSSLSFTSKSGDWTKISGSDDFLHNVGVVFYDDPYILDDIKEPISTFEIHNKITHKDYLRFKLSKCQERQSTLFKMKNEETIKKIEKFYELIVPGSYVYENGDSFYQEGSSRLVLNNLATGSKFFFIMKMLLESGQLTEGSLLILDEPEAHLHPDWINILAEFLVVLKKELNVSLLVTTQSSNLVLALEAFGKKHEVYYSESFYMPTFKDEKGMITFSRIDDLKHIYSHLIAGYENAYEELKRQNRIGSDNE